MIDWDLIGHLEGERFHGYVPNPKGSKSGVTIASGVDLSAFSAATLAGLPQDLIDTLSPYFGLRGQAALDILAAKPLEITPHDADRLDAFVRARALTAIASRYDDDSDVAFLAIPDAAQTVIASVSFQYGPDLRERCPKFWNACIAQDWPAVIAELRDFGDAYPTRHDQEADYLESHL